MSDTLPNLDDGYRGPPCGRARRLTPRQAPGWRRAPAVWASASRSKSSYGGSWDVSNLRGAPQVFPKCGDHSGAWAPDGSECGTQWFEVDFDAEAPAAEVHVYETCGPGAIFAAVGTDADGRRELLWQAPPERLDDGKARVLVVELERPRRLRTVRFYLDTTLVGDYNEIDAVAVCAQAGALEAEAPVVVLRGPVGGEQIDALNLEMGYHGPPYGRAHRFDSKQARGWREVDSVWASASRSKSSYGGSWDVSNLRGAPQVFPKCGDHSGAWAPDGSECGTQWFEVDFDADAPAAEVHVYETCGPGAIFAAVGTDADGRRELLWQAPPERLDDGKARVLVVELERPRRLRTVRFYLDTTLVGDYNEIDAVAVCAQRGGLDGRPEVRTRPEARTPPAPRASTGAPNVTPNAPPRPSPVAARPASGWVCLVCRATGEDEDAAVCAACGESVVVLGRYRVVRAIGQGGSSRSFEVERVSDGQRLALKLLDVARLDDWKMLEHFRRQLGLLSGLDHAGIPRGVEHFSLDLRGSPCECLVQELVPGTSLERVVVEGSRRYDDAAARRFLEQMLDILAYLHGFSPPILHRDIKPANIIVQPDGSPALIDFDTARGHAIDHSMADGTMVGTAGYVPAEQLAGRAVPASDLYGLGMTLIRMLSGREVTDLPVERMRVQFDGFVNVSDGLVEVLRGLIEPIVEDRLQSVDEVRAALRRGSPAPQRAPEARSRPSSSSRKSASSSRKSSSSPRTSSATSSRKSSSSSTPSSRPSGRTRRARGQGFAAFSKMADDVGDVEASDASPLRRKSPTKRGGKPNPSRGPRDAGEPLGSARRLAESAMSGWRDERCYLWASSARASSTYGAGWEASVAVGQPRVFPDHGDRQGAWAPKASRGGVEWLEVSFPTGPDVPDALAVHVFETFNPGAVFAVEVIGTTPGSSGVVWLTDRVEQHHAARCLEVEISPSRQVQRCRLWLDTSQSESWNEIDTVALLCLEEVAGSQGLRVGFGGRRVNWGRLITCLVLAVGAGWVLWMIFAGGPSQPEDLDDIPVEATLTDTEVWFVPAPQPVTSGVVWASGTHSVTSTYGDGSGWSSGQTLGAPDVYPRHGDLQQAWASEQPDAGLETVTVTFPRTRARGVVVVETFNPGAIVRVDAVEVDHASGPGAVALWSGTTDWSSVSRQAIFELAEPREIEAVRVVLNTSRVEGWNEIDAIGLLPAPD